MENIYIEQGVRFECQQCGKCCTGAPGAVYVSENEIENIFSLLDQNADEFKENYLYPYKDSFSIKEEADGKCVFYEGKGCSIYSVRPEQCRTYPFWIKKLRSEENWQKTCKECPGIGQGKLYEKEEILDILDKNYTPR